MRSALMVLAVGMGLASCGGDDFTGPDNTSIYGTYELYSIGGQALPCCQRLRVDNEQGLYMEVEIESGTWTLNRDDTWSATTTIHTTILAFSGAQLDEETETIPKSGTYIRTETELLFTASEGTTYSGSLSGPALTVMLADDSPAVYRK